ncbi:MAG TPA: hypothetical protein PKN12_06440 [Bacteroidales bacterium]|jgi:hypothetical protein|nr:hypothetical protein [Bacteroidales bacterium]HPT10329.1 hypothetical protein [Bacteroidales bacterium]
MKKHRYSILIVILLAVAALILWLSQSTSTFKRALSDFAVKDTASVTRIFMSDKNNNTVKLVKEGPGQWKVNDKYQAQKLTVEMLLKTMSELAVSQPVASAAQDNIIREMAVNAVKVEVYQKVYRIDWGGWIRWFPHEKRTKVFYVGGATQNNLGSYMLMENSSRAFVTYLPGFRGFVSPRFSPIEKYWRDYTIFRKQIPEIASVKVEIPGTPELSYELKNNGSNFFTFISLADNRIIPDYDTLKALNFLSGFRNLNFETLINDMDLHRKDSILSSPPFIVITLTDTAGVQRSIKTWHKQGPEGQTDPLGNPLPYDLDRLYALVNDGQDFTLIQYFTFDKVLRPKTFFLREASGNKN